MDGTHNVWIIKPGYNARGIGVHCFNTLKEAHSYGSKSNNKIIQKYIENSFLLDLHLNNSLICKSAKQLHKFDIRQWVLVTSAQPLTIYMFDRCYLKICGEEFSLFDLKNKYRHLSNYSVQKNNTKLTDGNQNNLTFSLPQFVQHLKEKFNM